jgi:cytochrome oxidase assembly protein ShyY1
VRWTLRQPRYAALTAGLFVVALLCIAAGTWQIVRFNQSVRQNDEIKGNAHAAAVPLTTALVPLVGQGRAPSREAIQFRTVTVTGSYLPAAQQFVRDQSVNGADGYYVLTPLRTADAALLVVRGFVAGDTTASGVSTPPPNVTPPPSGVVRLTGRLQVGATKNDGASELTDNEVEAINPADQSRRLGVPVYDADLTLDTGQPGTAGLTVLPKPDLSNPAGGAYEAQHFAYIIQWYLFALLALAAPFAMGRSELREARQRLLGIDTGNEEFGLKPAEERLELTGEEAAAGSTSGGTVAVRENGTLVQYGEPTRQHWRRAAKLADRYGRSISIDPVPELNGLDDADTAGESGSAGEQAPRRNRIGGVPAGEPVYRAPDFVSSDSAARPHRSHDAFHGSYNDYLWQLALADGDIPEVPAGEPPATPEEKP